MAHRDACAKGHRYTEESTAWRADGSRRCRICDKLWRDMRRERIKRLDALLAKPQPLTGQDPRR